MDKSILEQYTELKKEIEDEERRIRKLEMELENLCVVRDTVTGSRPDLTIGPISVKGYPFPEERRKKMSLAMRKKRREEKKAELEEMVVKVEEYIDSVRNSKIRRIMRLKYIDGLTWKQVANEMNKTDREKYYSEDGCRVMVNDFLKKPGR